MKKYYVEYFYPGSFVSETSLEEIDENTINIKVPKNCFAFRFCAREELYLEEKLLTSKFEYGANKMYYIGQEMSYEEVKAQYDGSALIFNMEANNWNYVVKTRLGNFQPVLEKDVVIQIDNNQEYYQLCEKIEI